MKCSQETCFRSMQTLLYICLFMASAQVSHAMPVEGGSSAASSGVSRVEFNQLKEELQERARDIHNLEQKIDDAARAKVPVGTILPFSGKEAPEGFLLCDGRELEHSKDADTHTKYWDLYQVIKDTYGKSDNANSFKIPNTQGLFLRGVGEQKVGDVTYKTEFGAVKQDKFQGHYHRQTSEGKNQAWSFVHGASDFYCHATTGHADGPYADNAYKVGCAVSDFVNGVPRTGHETRPANLGVHYIIKY